MPRVLISKRIHTSYFRYQYIKYYVYYIYIINIMYIIYIYIYIYIYIICNNIILLHINITF